IGVFTSFTLSQAGMVRHHQKLHEPGWRSGTVIDGVGAVATGLVTLIVAVNKFTIGAWVPIVVVPLIILVFRAIKRHYDRLHVALSITPEEVRHQDLNHTVVVLVGRVHRGVITALDYAKSLRPNHLMVLYIASDDEERKHMEAEWKRFGFDVPLEIVHSRYRDLVAPVETFLDELDDRWSNDVITIIIPEFVVGLRSIGNLLHGQSALALKLALLERPGTVVTSVPFHPTPPPGKEPGGRARARERERPRPEPDGSDADKTPVTPSPAPPSGAT
ncbi:MAG: hypothetical protein ACR2HV_11680, partial [Acidimicrobiales bacterium]